MFNTITVFCRQLKKLAAIFFLGIFVFNLVGYRWVNAWQQTRHDAAMEARLDASAYDAASLIEIRVPVSLPYQTDWAEFQRKDGSIAVNGIQYTYVMCKLQGGEMIYKCLPDLDKTHLINSRENFFQLVNDLQTGVPKKTGAPAPAKSFQFDYCEEILTYACTRPGEMNAREFGSLPPVTVPDVTLLPAVQPPDVA